MCMPLVLAAFGVRLPRAPSPNNGEGQGVEVEEQFLFSLLVIACRCNAALMFSWYGAVAQ